MFVCLTHFLGHCFRYETRCFAVRSVLTDNYKELKHRGCERHVTNSGLQYVTSFKRQVSVFVQCVGSERGKRLLGFHTDVSSLR